MIEIPLAYGDALAADSRLPFGVCVVSGVSLGEARPFVDQAHHGFPAELEARLGQTQERIGRFDAFFREHGYRCPLPHQLATARKKGLPRIDPLVETLLYCEMTHGLLMGVQDWGKVEGGLVYDAAAADESFPGMRGTVECRAGEMVLRDDAGIIASYFQGPDQRTRVAPATKDAVFFAFAAPGIEPAELRAALERAAEVLAPASAGARIELLEP